jgi:Uma2 family endonuclease
VPPTLFLDEPPREVATWLERRRALGQDRRDEVWEGVYHVVPAAHFRHGDAQAQLVQLLGPRAAAAGLRAVGEINIGSSRHDFRVPDITIVKGRDHDLYLPTASIVVEIVSPGDESYQKFGFYFAHAVEEVLIVDPQRRTVEWYARGADAFVRAGRSALLDVDEPTLHGEIDWPPT